MMVCAKCGQPLADNDRGASTLETSEKLTHFASEIRHQPRPGLTQPIHSCLRKRTEKPLPLLQLKSEPHAICCKQHRQRGFTLVFKHSERSQARRPGHLRNLRFLSCARLAQCNCTSVFIVVLAK